MYSIGIEWGTCLRQKENYQERIAVACRGNNIEVDGSNR